MIKIVKKKFYHLGDFYEEKTKNKFNIYFINNIIIKCYIFI